MSTFFINKKDVQTKSWQVVDARGQIVGRLASRIARILMGKEEPDFTPHVETGSGVIVLNASQVRVTGNKPKTKMYKSYSGYPKGLIEKSYERVLKEDPTHIIRHAVEGMLPKSRLGSRMASRLLVYPGMDHPHKAQKPKTVEWKQK